MPDNATGPQQNLLARLLPEKLDEEKLEEVLAGLRPEGLSGLSRSSASRWIERLLAMPSQPPAPDSDLGRAVAWLKDRSKPTAFEKGLLEQFAERGSLSPRQIEVVLERTGSTGQAPTATLVPAGRYAVQIDDEWQLFRVWRGQRNPNVQHVYAVQGTEKGERISGALEAQALAAIALDPAKAAIAFGHRTGSCSRCGLELDVNLTRYMGIGPVCIKHFASDDARLTMLADARETLRAAGIDPAGHNDDLSAAMA